MMSIGSVFSGIGGLELGLEWSGVGQTVWQVEIDSFRRSILARHWPNALRFDDIRMVGRNELDPVDIICGGFPCQDVSNAGTKKGLAGKRSGLWFHFRRIVEEICPSWVVIENVTALRRRGLVTVLSDLAALGYDAEWHSFRASDIGAPHQRDRIFVIAGRAMADADSSQSERGRRSLELGGATREDAEAQDQRKWNQRAIIDCVNEGCSELVNPDAPRWDRMQSRFEQALAGDVTRPISLGRLVALSQPSMGDVSHGIPDRVARWPAARNQAQFNWEPARTSDVIDAARLRALGDAVCPQMSFVVGQRLQVLIKARENVKVMARPHRKYGTDTRVVGARLTPDELRMLEQLRLRRPGASQSDVLRSCLETVAELRDEELVKTVFDEIIQGG